MLVTKHDEQSETLEKMSAERPENLVLVISKSKQQLNISPPKHIFHSRRQQL